MAVLDYVNISTVYECIDQMYGDCVDSFAVLSVEGCKYCVCWDYTNTLAFSGA